MKFGHLPKKKIEKFVQFTTTSVVFEDIFFHTECLIYVILSL